MNKFIEIVPVYMLHMLTIQSLIPCATFKSLAHESSEWMIHKAWELHTNTMYKKTEMLIARMT